MEPQSPSSLFSWNGIELNTVQKISGDSKAGLMLIHGFSEYAGIYDELTDKLAGAGIDTYLLELPGFGLSKGLRACIDSYDDYIDVLAKYCSARLPKNGNKLFLYGHSMGGMLAVNLLSKLDQVFDGLILSAPFFNIYGKNESKIRFTMNVLKFFTGADYLPTAKFPPRGLENPKTWHGYFSDGKRIKTIHLKLLRAMLDSNEEWGKANHIPNLPTLVLMAEKDHVVWNATIRKYFEGIRNENKKFVVFLQSGHELNLDYSKNAYHASIINWLTNNI